MSSYDHFLRSGCALNIIVAAITPTSGQPDSGNVANLSALELTILANLERSTDRKLLSEILKVDKQVVASKFDKLRTEGYITREDYLTEKGFEAVRRGRQEGRIRPRGESPKPEAETATAGQADELSNLDVALLAGLVHVKDDEGLSRLAGVDSKEVEARLDRLYNQGYITEDNRLSSKGYEAASKHRGGPLSAEAISVPFGSGMERLSKRPVRVALSATFILLYGIAGIALGLMFIFEGLFMGAISTGIDMSGLAEASLGGLVLGGIFVAMGVAGVASGWGLWRGERWGAYLGAVLLVAGIGLTTIPFLIANNPSPALTEYEFEGVILAGNSFLLILLLWAFSRLSS